DLLQWRGNRFGDHFRAGARIARRNLYRRRGDLRILTQRQFQERESTADQHQDREDYGKDRAVDEKARNVHRRASRTFAAARSASPCWPESIGTICGFTSIPGLTSPLIMIFSLDLSPAETTRSPSIIGPSSIGRYSALFPAPSTST